MLGELSMKALLLISILFLYSCAALEPVSDDIKEIANNDAVTVKVDRDSFQKDTDVHVSVDILNKDQPTQHQ